MPFINMSYFEPNKSTVNPASKFISWSGSEGKFSWYNKETKENIFVGKLEILPLKPFSTIKGWSESDQGNFVSNEVADLAKEELNVRMFGKNTKGEKTVKPVISGFYKDIKDQLKLWGAKYSQSIYAIDLSTGEIINIQFNGSSLGVWIEANTQYRANIDAGQTLILGTNPEVQKKGATKYYIPAITLGNIDESLLERAKTHYNLIVEYYNQYSTQNLVAKEVSVESEQEAPTGVITNDLPEIDVDNINVQMPY